MCIIPGPVVNIVARVGRNVSIIVGFDPVQAMAAKSAPDEVQALKQKVAHTVCRL